ncbi:MAG: ammonium transporter [Desulfovibrio sp.]|jgi:Amt family ammonium transporter|nr:ammonium transporter [Desulfovibrio sp.]
MDASDTAFIIISACMVMLMTPALAMFYGGLVRSRNVLSTHMHSYACLGVISVLWAILGYTLAFGGDVGGIIGNLDHFLMKGVEGVPAPAAEKLPHTVFVAFQCMFAVLTVSLISGAYAERIRFSAMLLFSCLWLLFAYAPMAHWVWGGGWMQNMGALDFAGGAVVHMASGAAALACAQALGPRMATGQGFIPNNLPLTLIGGGMLWFGWFGFNAGSALASGALAGQALLNTHLASACGILGWMLVEWKRTGKPTTLGVVSGALAGLVAITPAAGFVATLPAMFIGFVGGMVCYGAVLMKNKLGYDDALDVVGIHGIGGTWGALATGVFATAVINEAGSGLLYGNPRQLFVQFVSVVGTWVFVYVMSRILLKVVDGLIGLRVPSEAEFTGLDLSEHNERGYAI